MPRARRSAASPSRRRSSDGAEADLLRPTPEHELAEVLQAVVALVDRGEVVAGELAHLAAEQRRPVREQDLGLAHPARVEQQLSGTWVAGGVLIAEAKVELAERDPGRLAAPARLDELSVERKHVLEGVARLRRRLGLEPGDEAEVADLDLYVHACIKVAPPPTRAAALFRRSMLGGPRAGHAGRGLPSRRDAERVVQHRADHEADYEREVAELRVVEGDVPDVQRV